MKKVTQKLRGRRIGLALSGGSVRGLAHIGVLKVLAEAGINPVIVAGTSVGSIVGAAVAAGLDWRGVAEMARAIFWPSLLHGASLERFCARYLPETFSQLHLPFAAVATEVPTRQVVTITDGHLASAISASCALRVVRRPVKRKGRILKDGGMACVLPAQICREMGADFVISSDVWELSSVLRRIGCNPSHPISGRLFPEHYRVALDNTDIFIQPSIPVTGYVPGTAAVERMIAVGEEAARSALARLC
jgi:NTE family protein